MAQEWPKSLEILAYREALSDKPSTEFSFRKLFRWYSKEFTTPLHIVETLPLFDILQHYYEAQAVALADSKNDEGQLALQEKLLELCKTAEELEKEKLEKARSDVSERKIMAGMEQHNKTATSAAQLKKKKELEAKIQRDLKIAKELDKIMSKDSIGAKLDINNQPQGLPEIADDFNPEENINMSFTGLEDLGDMDGLSTLTGL